MTGPAPICIKGNCKHWTGKPPEGEVWGFACAAFPTGIPDSIIVYGNPHDKPLLNQLNDIVYEREKP